MEENEKWGVGNRKDEKAFHTVTLGQMNDQHKEEAELIFGEHPHSRQDNNIYVRKKDGEIEGFSGHRIPMRIEIEEYNYMKRSGVSGNEVRKGGNVKVYADGIQIFDGFCRSYDYGYRQATDFINSLELMWDWFPKKVENKIGTVVAYNEQLFKIESFIISQGCMILVTLDGKPRKRFIWEDLDDFDDESGDTKVEITAPGLSWYPKYEGMPED